MPTTQQRVFVSAFILLSTLLFLFVRNPVRLLLLAGAVNGLILPIALAVMLLAVHRKKIWALWVVLPLATT